MNITKERIIEKGYAGGGNNHIEYVLTREKLYIERCTYSPFKCEIKEYKQRKRIDENLLFLRKITKGD